MLASATGQPYIADALITAGADMHVLEPRMGAAALHKAAQSGNGDIIALLLSWRSLKPITSMRSII